MKTLLQHMIEQTPKCNVDLETVKTELEKTVNHVQDVTFGVYSEYKSWIDVEYIDDKTLKQFYYGIKQNAITFQFKIEANSCALVGSGHVYISPYDSENEYKYFAMRSIKEMAKEVGVSTRKFKFKDEKDLAKKITKMSNELFGVALAYCGGDLKQLIENHQGTIETSLKDAYKK